MVARQAVESRRERIKPCVMHFPLRKALLFVCAVAIFVGAVANVAAQTFEVLYQPPGTQPRSSLIQGSNGNYYGMTYSGGLYGNGTIFMISGGAIQTLLSFDWSNGGYPYGELIEASDGYFYGTTSAGGKGSGTVFKMTPDGALTTLVSFNSTNGRSPNGGLVEGQDGNFYGTTSTGGPSNAGTVFKMTPAGVVSTLVSFGGANGQSPSGGLVEHNGSFYGTTLYGGTKGNGTVFSITPGGVLTTLVSFNSPTSGPQGRLLKGTDGFFYGVTNSGGFAGGTIYKMTPDGVLTNLVSFSYNGANGSNPRAGLIEGSDGFIYGTTQTGGSSGYGTVFKMTPAGSLTTLVSFTGANGANPQSELFQGSDGSFYGTTYGNSISAFNGTVFKMTPAGALTTIASLAPPVGDTPYTGLVEHSDGTFYGTTYGGVGYGTAFKVTPTGMMTWLLTFTQANGIEPQQLAKGTDGNFYGVTYMGGAKGYGAAFRMTPAGVLTQLASFDQATFGGYPKCELLQGSDGTFYGTTTIGGANSGGTFFRLTTRGLITLYSFSSADARNPQGRIVQDSGGTFYGTTYYGGSGYGTVYSLTPAGVFTKLATLDFNNGWPTDGLIKGNDGNFYGTGNHSVFRITPDGVLTTVATLTSSQGSSPHGIIQGSDGNFYGVSPGGGAAGLGTIFKIKPDGSVTVLYSFDGSNAKNPWGTPVFGMDGNLYGTALPMSIWRLKLTPTVATDAPTGVAVNGVTLRGSVSPNGSTTSAQFEYGSTASYGSSAVLTLSPDDSPTAQGVSAPLTGLMPNTTYHYRLTATNFAGTSSSADATFMTAPNTAPVVTLLGSDPLTFEASSSYQDAGATAYDIDEGMLTPIITENAVVPGVPGSYSVTWTATDAYGASGTATRTVNVLDTTAPSFTSVPGGSRVIVGTVIPDLTALAGASDNSAGPVSIGQSPAAGEAFGPPGPFGITLTATDPLGNEVAAVVNFTVTPADPWTDVLFAAQGLVPGAGADGIPEGARWMKFGLPATNDAGHLACLAWLRGYSRGLLAGVAVGDPAGFSFVAKQGDVAPDSTGAPSSLTFTDFEDPVLDSNGRVTFLAKLSGGGNKNAIFSNADGTLKLVAREGDQPPGLPVGTEWKKLGKNDVSLALSDGPTSSLFVTQATGPRGWAGKARGLWGMDATGTLQLIVREGQGVGNRTLESFDVLASVGNSPGQTRSFNHAGEVLYRATFVDGSQGIVRAILNLPPPTNETLFATGDAVSGGGAGGVPSGATWSTFGIPATNDESDVAFLATLSLPTGSAAGVFAGPAPAPALVAKAGDIAPDASGGLPTAGPTFSGFQDPLLDGNGRVTFLATLTGDGVTSSNDEAIYSDADGKLTLIAREGGQAPDVPTGARWLKFTSIAMPDGPASVLFEATMMPGSGDVTDSNDTGLWAMDSTGALRLLVRKGDTVDGRTLVDFKVLRDVSGSPGQTRSFNAAGEVVYQATFSNDSQAIVRVSVP